MGKSRNKLWIKTQDSSNPLHSERVCIKITVINTYMRPFINTVQSICTVKPALSRQPHYKADYSTWLNDLQMFVPIFSALNSSSKTPMGVCWNYVGFTISIVLVLLCSSIELEFCVWWVKVCFIITLFHCFKTFLDNYRPIYSCTTVN